MSKGKVNGGVKTVAAAATAEALSTSQECSAVLVQALEGNTGKVYVGGSDVSSSTKNGAMLEAKQAVTVPAENLTQVFVAVAVNGEGVSYIWIP